MDKQQRAFPLEKDEIAHLRKLFDQCCDTFAAYRELMQHMVEKHEALAAENARMRETLLLFVPYPDKPPTPPPQKHHYDIHDDWVYREDRDTWVNEQNARKALGLPHIEDTK